MRLILVNRLTQESIRIEGSTVLVGRDPLADVPIDDPKAGPHQCMLGDVWDGQWAVWDLGTEAGTFVNGHRVNKAILATDDELMIGTTTFSVKLECPLPVLSIRPYVAGSLRVVS